MKPALAVGSASSREGGSATLGLTPEADARGALGRGQGAGPGDPVEGGGTRDDTGA